MNPVLPDPAGTRAVLVGVSKYETLEQLPQVQANLHALRDILTDPDHWALPTAHCTVLHQPDRADDVLDALDNAADAVTDTLLFYFAGHGLLDVGEDDELHLALPQAEKARPHRAGVAYRLVRRALLDAGRALRKIVILDCCYSGQALRHWMGDDAARLPGLVGVDGTYVLTASAKNRSALAPPGEEHTAFTGELVRILREGVPDGPEMLDIDRLFQDAAARLRSKDRPVPQRGVLGLAGRVALARNAAHPAFIQRALDRTRAEHADLRTKLAAAISRAALAEQALARSSREIEALSETIVPAPAPAPGPTGWVIGNPGRSFGAIMPSLTAELVPDTVIDGGQVGDLAVRAASVRGLAHRQNWTARQDAYAVAASTDRQWLVAVVADGVSSAERSHVASNLVARMAARALIRALDEGATPAKLAVPAILDALASAIVREGSDDLGREAEGPEVARLMATTVMMVICQTSGPYQRQVFAAGYGDSSVWAVDTQRQWTRIDAYDRSDVASFPVRALPILDRAVDDGVTRLLPATSSIFVMTDGVGDPLGNGTGEVAAALAEAWASPPALLQFAEQVGFGRLSFADDRTVIGIWPT